LYSLFTGLNNSWGKMIIMVRNRYFTGKPCRRGHISERYASNATCVECAKETMVKWRESNKESYNEYHLDYGPRWRKRKVLKQATPVWSNEETIQRVREECKRMSASMRMRFVLDHVIPLRGRTVCGLHVPENLKIVSESFNNLKGNKFNSRKESKRQMEWLKARGF